MEYTVYTYLSRFPRYLQWIYYKNVQFYFAKKPAIKLRGFDFLYNTLTSTIIYYFMISCYVCL